MLIDKVKQGIKGTVPLAWNNEGAYFERVADPHPADDLDPEPPRDWRDN